MNTDKKMASLLGAFERDPFGSSFGLLARSAEVSSFSSVLAVDTRHQIDNSFVHGGCIAAICEQTNRFAALTVMPAGAQGTTTALQVNYLSGASGNRLVCNSSVIATAPQGLIVDAVVYGGKDNPTRLVANCRSTVAPALPEANADPVVHPIRDATGPGVVVTGRAAENGSRNFIKEDFTGGWRRFCGFKPFNASYGSIDMQVDARPADEHGWVESGLIAPLADAAGGACAYSTVGDRDRLATLEFSVTYLRPSCAPSYTARARAIKAGKTIIVSRVDIFAVDGASERLIATSFVTVTHVPGHERLLRERSEQAAASVPIAGTDESIERGSNDQRFNG